MRTCHLFVRFFVVYCSLAILVSSCQKQDQLTGPNINSDVKLNNSQVAIDWYKLQLQFLLERNSTMNGVYFGYMGIGLYEAVQPGIRNAKSLSGVLYQMPAMPSKEKNEGYNWELSANAAMAALLKSFNTGLTTANLATIDSLENAYNNKLKPSSGTKFKRSQTFGRAVAAAVHAWSLTDNFNPSNAGYVYPVFDGGWVPTPPALVNPPVLPFLSTARPFVASNLGALAASPAFPYSSNPTSDFFKMHKEVYDVSQGLTQEQKDIALFWVDQGNNSGFTPPGHDLSLVIQAIEAAGSDLGTAAEALAKAGIAERDATIVCFASKYTYNTMRPVTFIQSFIDNTWLSFIPTPPHPEYPAAHAFISGSALKAAQQVLGVHEIMDHTYAFKGWGPRAYSSLFAAGEEAGISRLYGGIHCRKSIEVSLQHANDIGTTVGNLNFKQ